MMILDSGLITFSGHPVFPSVIFIQIL